MSLSPGTFIPPIFVFISVRSGRLLLQWASADPYSLTFTHIPQFLPTAAVPVHLYVHNLDLVHSVNIGFGADSVFVCGWLRDVSPLGSLDEFVWLLECSLKWQYILPDSARVLLTSSCKCTVFYRFIGYSLIQSYVLVKVKLHRNVSCNWHIVHVGL